MAKTATVTVPMGVLPTSSGPCQAKWSVQRSVRGLNSGTCCPSRYPAIFGPLWELQRSQLNARFSAVVGTAVFFSNDVIHLKWQQRDIRREVAILTPTPGTLPDQLLQGDVHAASRRESSVFE